MKTVTTKFWRIQEHPNPEKCVDWFADSVPDLADCSRDEVIDSLKAFADHIGFDDVRYSIAIHPERGEFVSLKVTNKDAETVLDKYFNAGDIAEWAERSESLQFTGMWSDCILARALKEGNIGTASNLGELADAIENKVLETMHEEGEYLYSDGAIRDHCEANGYYFNEHGEADFSL